MKKKSLIRVIPKRSLVDTVYSCMTKLSSLVSAMFVSALLISCAPKTNNNYYTNPNSNKETVVTDSVSGGGGASGDGGGGQGVLCGDTVESKIQNRLWVRDLYEAVSNHNLDLKKIPGAENENEISDEAVKILTDSIKAYLGPASPNTEYAQKQFWKKFVEQISFLDDNQDLFTSKDANSPIALPSGCQLVQIAYWDESSGSDDQGTLYVSRPLWNKLDQINKIGLLAHEFFFKQARKANYRNSDFVRNKVGRLLSTTGLPSNFANWTSSKNHHFKNLFPASRKGFKFCEGISNSDPTAKIHLYQYQGDDNHQHLVFSHLSSKMINMSAFQNGHFRVKNEISLPIPSLQPTQEFMYLSNYLTYISDFSNEAKLLRTPDKEFTDSWYDNSGLLSDRRGGINFSRLLAYYQDKSSQVAPYVWKDMVHTSTSSIEFALLDPRYDSQANNEPRIKSKDELIATINAKLRNRLKKCDYLQDDSIEVSRLISALHVNIDRSLAKGVFLSSKAWKQSLAEVVKYFSSQNSDANGINNALPKYCDFGSDEELTYDVPALIYNVKLNNYSESDLKKVLGQDAYQFRETQHGNRTVQLKVSQGNSSLNFDLTCSDFMATYEKYISRSITVNTDRLRPNSKMEISYNLGVDSGLPTPEMIKKLGSHLSGAGRWYDSLGDTQCRTVNNDLTPICSSYFLFAETLSKETNLSIQNCSSEGYAESPQGSSCAILSLKDSKLKFLIRFHIPVGLNDTNGQAWEVPEIDFIRIIPN